VQRRDRRCLRVAGRRGTSNRQMVGRRGVTSGTRVTGALALARCIGRARRHAARCGQEAQLPATVQPASTAKQKAGNALPQLEGKTNPNGFWNRRSRIWSRAQSAPYRKGEYASNRATSTTDPTAE